MTPEQWVKQVYRDIWQGHAIDKVADYYAEDVQAMVSVSPKEQEIDDIELGFSDVVKQAAWQKDNCHNIQFDFKSIFSDATGKKISIYFYSQTQSHETGEVRHYRVSGEYHLNDAGKIAKVFAVMLPFYPFKHSTT
jgi:hypothetical protein